MDTNRAALPLLFDVWENIFDILEEEDAEPDNSIPRHRPDSHRARWYYATLKNCNAASYALHTICQPLLFRSVTVAICDVAKRRLQGFLQLVQGNQNLRHHIRRLTLVVSRLSSGVVEDSDGMCEGLDSVLRELDGLKWLDCRIEDNWVLIPPVFQDMVMRLLASPTVTTVKILKGVGWPLSVFSQCPQVEDLTIGFVEWETDVKGPPEIERILETAGAQIGSNGVVSPWSEGTPPLYFHLPKLEHLDLEIFSAPSGTIGIVLPLILRGSTRLKTLSCNVRGEGRSWVEHAAHGLADALSLSPSLTTFKLKAKRAELLPRNVTGIATELENILCATPPTLEILFEIETGENEMTFWMSDEWLGFDRAISQARVVHPNRSVHLSLVMYLSEMQVMRGSVPVWQLPTYLPSFREVMGQGLKIRYLPDELHPAALYATTL